jgi:hypothetical protein
MTSTPNDPTDLVPMPPGAIELEGASVSASPRAMAVAALQQALRERQLSLPLGPETALTDEDRLLILNGFAVQLSTGGVVSDELEVDATPWASPASAPQLLVAALVDEENAVVAFPGVLTGAELIQQAQRAERRSGALVLDPLAFRGGVDRLLSLVQLLEPSALPRLALTPPGAAAIRSVVEVIGWLRGHLDDTVAALGGELRPVSAGAFRSGNAATDSTADALAMVVIPFGLSGDQLVSGDSARRCVRQFQLALIPTGSDQPTALMVRLSSAVPGALLPDGLRLEALQGTHRQTINASGSTALELVFAASDELLDVSLSYGDGQPTVLPSLRLPV